MNKIEVLSAESEDEVLLRPIDECLTPKMAEAVRELGDDIRNLTLVELEDRIEPTVVLRQVKLSFWKEYAKTLDEQRKSIDISAVCSGICNREFFYSAIVRKEEVLAWLFYPPTEFDKAAEEALNYGIPKIRRMLDAPLFKQKEDGSDGEFIPANAASVLNAVKYLDARVKGSPLQRSEVKSLHLHKNADSPKGISRDEMHQELELLRQRLSGTPIQIQAPEDTE